MNRFASIPWPLAGVAVVLLLLVQEMLLRHAGAANALPLASWRIAVAALGVSSLAMLLLPPRRIAYALGALACAALIGYALYAQYVLGYEPCPLCIFQRVGVIAAGIVFLAAAIHNPGRAGGVAYAVLMLVVAGLGAAVAARHVWLQTLPPDKVPACGAGLSYMLETLPFSDVLSKVLTGSGECASVDWRFLDMTMPAWTMVAFVVMIVAMLVLAKRG